MRHGAGLGLLTLAVAGAASCGGDTAILLEVSRAEDVGELQRLAIFAGTDVVNGGGFADRTPDDDVALDGRDLAVDPYRLLLEPTDASEGRAVMAAAIGVRDGEVVAFGALDGPVGFVDGETVSWPIVLEAALPRGLGTDVVGCLRWFDDDGERVVIGSAPDLDCDGFAADDCDDLDPAVSPAGSDACGSGVDEDCDGAVDEDVDDDADGFTTCGGDCDDRAGAVNPGAAEACNGLDDDCDGGCDVGFDQDGDRYTGCGSKLHDDGACDFDPGSLTDCDDGSADVRPFAEEVCDGLDNDCSGACDDDGALDPDGDAFTACGSVVGTCGTSDADVDCAPDDGAISPGAAERCDGVDDDCDGAFLESAPCFAAVGEACHPGTRACDDAGAGGFSAPCVADATPGSEVDPALCDAYAACEEAAEIDPYACAVEAAATEALLCVVAYQPAIADQCPGRTTTLPTGGAALCTWRVPGGIQQGDYRVGLLPPGEVDFQITGPCDSLLDIAPAVYPPGPLTVVLERLVEGEAPSYLRVEVAAAPTATCSPPEGLACAPAP